MCASERVSCSSFTLFSRRPTSLCVTRNASWECAVPSTFGDTVRNGCSRCFYSFLNSSIGPAHFSWILSVNRGVRLLILKSTVVLPCTSGPDSIRFSAFAEYMASCMVQQSVANTRKLTYRSSSESTIRDSRSVILICRVAGRCSCVWKSTSKDLEQWLESWLSSVHVFVVIYTKKMSPWGHCPHEIWASNTRFGRERPQLETLWWKFPFLKTGPPHYNAKRKQIKVTWML